MPDAGLLEHMPPWLLIVIVIAFGLQLILKIAAESSDTAVKLLGPLGRRWRARAELKASRKKTEMSSMTRQQLQAMVDEAVEAKTNELTDELHELIEYLAYDAEHHRKTRIHMAEKGWVLPPPDHMTLTEWRKMRTYQSGGSR